MKMNQLKKKMIPLAMAMALVATGFAGNLAVQKTAFAEGAGGTGKTLIIKKVLTMPSEGVTTPDETFNFKFEAQSFNGNTNNPTQTCPAISNATAAYTTSGTQNDADGSKAGKQVVVATDDALKNVTWSKAGQYVYKVTEVEPNPGKAGMTYSKAEYTVSIFVSGTTGNFKVHSIQIKQSKKDDRTVNDSAAKTEYNPTNPTGSDNNFAFENKYFPTGGNDNPGAGDPSDADKKGLVVSKKVADGAGASNTQTFKFSMNIAKPEGLVDDSANFTYVVVSGGGKTVGQVQTGTYGSPVEIDLAHGDKVVLKSVHMGAKATVTETDSAGYTAKYKVTSNGTAGSETEGTAASALLGDANGGNSIEFTNTQQTPAGVIIDNLPFIILVAIAGMGILFFVRNKRRAEEF